MHHGRDASATSGTRSPATAWPLTGRSSLLAEVEERLRRIRGPIVVLQGPAGVGKTRLLDELARRVPRPQRLFGAPALSSIPLAVLAPLLADGDDDEAVTMAALLRSVRRDRPTLLVDDLQDVDPVTLALLPRLRDQGARVVATQRSGAPLTSEFPPATTERIVVPPLDDVVVSDLLERALGGPVEVATSRRLVGAAGHNLVWLQCLVDDLLAEGDLVRHDGGWQLVGDVLPGTTTREVLAHHLGRLPVAAREVVDLLAAVGALPLDVVTTLHTAAAVAAAEAAGVLAVTGTTIQIRHPLLAETARAALPRTHQVQLIRMAVTATAGNPNEDVGLRRVLWQLDLGQTPAEGELVAAAETALRRRSPDLASRLVGVTTSHTLPVLAARLRATVLSGSGDGTAAVAVLAEALTHVTNQEDAVELVRQHFELLLYVMHDIDGAQGLADLAAMAPDADPEVLALLGAELAQWRGDLRGAVELAQPLARDDVPDPIRAVATMFAASGLVLTGRSAELDGLPRPESFPLTHDGQIGIVGWSLASCEAGAADRGLALAQQAWETAAGGMTEAAEPWAAMAVGRAQYARGDVAEARRWFASAAAQFGDLGRTGFEQLCVAGLVWCAAIRGDRRELRARLRWLDDLEGHGMGMLRPEVLIGRAWGHAVLGDVPAAADCFDQAHDLAARSGATAWLWRIATDAVRLRLPGARRWRRGLGDPTSPVERALALRLAARTPGELVAAGHGLADVERWLEAAECAATAARDLAGSNVRVRTARRLATVWAAHVDSPTTITMPAAAAAPLTPRELEVASLAALGMTTREVADELEVSARTAQTHLHRAYAKLGVHDRESLAARLASS